jgi:hypothetical protein
MLRYRIRDEEDPCTGRLARKEHSPFEMLPETTTIG